MKLKHIALKTRNVLEKYPEARNSDMILYLRYCEEEGLGITEMPLARVLLDRKALGLPTFESIGRARRKLQSEYPHLKATAEVTDLRYEKWKEFRTYALE